MSLPSDEFDFSSDADDALVELASQPTPAPGQRDGAAEDDYFSDDGDDALIELANTPAPSKRKFEDVASQSQDGSSKRVKYPETSELARKVLKETFGLEAFRLKQEAAIARLLEGGNAAVVFPTGGGKSLCYQVPAIAFGEQDAAAGIRGPSDGGVTIVVSPLIALMKDQVDALRKRGVYACAMDSSKKREEYLQTQEDIRAGLVKIIYCAPERLNNEGFVGSIKNIRGGVRLVAVDEAHCVSEWGHSFRPDYLKVARFTREIRAERVVCLTATATPTVAKDICDAFGIESGGLYRTAMYRPNLRLLVQTTNSVQAKFPLLFKFLRNNPGPTIVYATVQKQTEKLADDLRKNGFNAVHFHAGETVPYKTKVQDDFLASSDMIIVATIAFGMGIDKPDIRNVIHFDMPSSIEAYSQQIGRAGRDGQRSNCLFFVCSDDFYLRDVFVYGDLPSIESVRRFIDAVCSTENASKRPGDSIEVSHYAQGREFDIRPTALSILYAQLELQFKLIRATTPKYSNYSFVASPRYFVSNVRGSSVAANVIFKHASKAQTLHHIDVDDAARQSPISRFEIVNKLNEWNDDNVIELKVSGVQNVYKLEKQMPITALERNQIAEKLFGQMHSREQQDMQRTKDVINLIESKSCLSRGLAKYFGDDSPGLGPECGHCTWCETHTAVIVPPRKVIEGERAAIGKVLDKVVERDDPRFLARIAFGIKSPRITALKHVNTAYFGSLKEHDFPALVRIFTACCNNAPTINGRLDTTQLKSTSQGTTKSKSSSQTYSRGSGTSRGRGGKSYGGTSSRTKSSWVPYEKNRERGFKNGINPYAERAIEAKCQRAADAKAAAKAAKTAAKGAKRGRKF